MKFSFFDSKRITSVIAVITGIITVLTTFVYFVQQKQFDRVKQMNSILELDKQKLLMDSIQYQQSIYLRELDNEKKRLLQQNDILIDSAFRNDNTIPKLKFYVDNELAKIKNDLSKADNKNSIDSLNQRLKALEDALMENPSKALAVPLLQNQIQSLKETEAKDIADTRASITTIYDQNKWFIGLMFTLAIGMISLAITNFIPKKDKFSEKPKNAVSSENSKETKE